MLKYLGDLIYLKCMIFNHPHRAILSVLSVLFDMRNPHEELDVMFLQVVVFIPSPRCLETLLLRVTAMKMDVHTMLTAPAIKRKATEVSIIIITMATKEMSQPRVAILNKDQALALKYVLIREKFHLLVILF